MDEETRRNFEIVAAPPGAEWSGRARYAAAMYLHRQGEMADDVLEVYRICARLDAEDPVCVLTRWRIGADWIAKLAAFRSR